MLVQTGNHHSVVATGSDVGSSFFRLDQTPSTESEPTSPKKAFSTEFLKWMLSDGAGAVQVKSTPAKSGLSLRIDWIEQRSYANKQPTCMYAGGLRKANGKIDGWREIAFNDPASLRKCLMIHQEVKLLNADIIDVCVNQVLRDVLERRPINPDEIDWFLPHYSSDFFRQPLYEAMGKMGLRI